MLDAIEIETAPHPTVSIIWLHGLGADGNDFVPIVPDLDLGHSIPIRYIFPHAPMRPISINGGAIMRAWYDMTDLSSQSENETHIRESQSEIEQFIERELSRGVTRVLLAGFSQGGAIALQTGLRYPKRLVGILALSTYLPLTNTLTAGAAPENSSIKIFMAHGVFDDVIPLALAEASRLKLEGAGYDIDWQTYQMAHQVCAPEIADVRAWLLQTLMSRN